MGLSVLFLICGLLCSIVQANAWFIIPVEVPYVLYGFAAFLFIVNIIIYFSAKRKINKTFNHQIKGLEKI